VWIVNLLLCCVTLGLYIPWARRRTARYFYRHTLVAGGPLEFTGRLRVPVPGLALVAMLVLGWGIVWSLGLFWKLDICLTYDSARSVGPCQKIRAGFLAGFLLSIVLLAPLVWGSAMRFRLDATRWRGLRLQSAARWRDIYRASWPLWVLALSWLGLYLARSATGAMPIGRQVLALLPAGLLGMFWQGAALTDVLAQVFKEKIVTSDGLAWLLLGLMLALLCLARLDYDYRRLRVCKAQSGAGQGHWRQPEYRDCVNVWLAAVALFVLSAPMLGLLVGAALNAVLPKDAWVFIFFGVIATMGKFYQLIFKDPTDVVVVGSILFLLLLVLSAPARAYREARMFQLMWNHIGIGQVARFKCRLSSVDFVLARFGNLLLTLLTLGLYRPLARVSEYRMKLESVTLYVKGGAGQVAGAPDDARAGDAAGRDSIGHAAPRDPAHDAGLAAGAQASGAPESAPILVPGPVPGAMPRDGYTHPLAFTGGTGAYFRVWIVNLLLCCVTLGLYTPWARQRTAQYFYRHTLVAGSPLEFTGRPRGQVLGFVLLLLLWLLLMLALASGILWSAWLHQMLRWIPIFDLRIKGDELPWLFRAAEWIPTFGIFASIGHKSMAVPVLAGAALLPWVWGSAMRFRLGATRWRGLRLQFASHWREIYGGSGLLWVLALLWGGLSWSLYFGFGSQPFSVPGLLADKPAIARFTVMIAWLLGAALTLLCLCRLDYNRLDLLLRKTRVGAEPVRHKRPVLPNVMETWLVTVMLCMLGLSLGFVVWKCLPGGYFDKPPFFGVGRSRNGSASVMSVLYRVVIVVLPLLLLSAPARAYREARMFQLVWNGIGVNQAAHFKCRLSSDRFVLLRIQNLLLTLLTLGFYRPLARLSEYRMKLASVTLHVTGDLDQVAGAMLRQQTGLGAVPDFSGRRALRHYLQRAQWLAPLRRLVHKLGPESPIPEGGKLPPLAFIGSAGAYFPVWLVNVLLCCVTLGLYAPWARRRTARYFYRHPLVAGRPLEFTGRPRPMLLIFVLLLLLAYGAMASLSTLIYLIYERGELALYGMAEGATFSAYDITGTFGQNLAVASFVLAGAALAPFFWGHAMRFRLGATVWRGLHLQFAAGWREVYRASRPLRVMALLWTGLFLYMRTLVPGLADSFLTWRALVLPALVLTLLCSIRLDYDSKSLLARNVWLGAGQVRWTPVYRDFVNVWLATVVLFILCMPGFVALNAVLTGGIFDLLARLPVRMPPRTGLTWFVLLDWFQETRSRAWFVLTMALFGLSNFLLLMLVSTPARAYREARMFQLLWNGIGIGQAAHCKCRLSSIGFVLARIGNLLLTLLTLGLYRPLARVSEYRMKLESVTLHVADGGVEQLTGAPAAGPR